MKLSHSLDLQLKQKLSLSHEMLLSLELIQLPLIDLKERIEQEILENPALELREKKKTDEQNYEKIEEAFNDEDNNYFQDSSSADLNTGYSPTDSSIDTKRQFLESSISHKDNLYDHLNEQLHLQDIPDKYKEIGTVIISLITEDGFFKENLEDVFNGDDLKIAEIMLEVIQLFDPSGVASPGIKEALIFQIESLTEDEINQNAYEILKDHFDLMLARKDNEIAKRMKLKPEELREAFEFISQFNPFPGRNYSSQQTNYIIPDAYVYNREGSVVVEMNDDILPSLTINKYIDKIAAESAKKKKMNKEERYVVNKIRSAKQFMNLIDYRNSSLFKLVLMLANLQEEFFLKGAKHLKPLTMKDVADQIGLSESTISRLASSKYIQTEWGLHEIKYFFSNSIGKNKGADNKSAESIREMIKEIFENEKDKKISDQKIVDILNERGIKIARRTVAKYRKILNILPLHQRKHKIE